MMSDRNELVAMPFLIAGAMMMNNNNNNTAPVPIAYDEELCRDVVMTQENCDQTTQEEEEEERGQLLQLGGHVHLPNISGEECISMSEENEPENDENLEQSMEGAANVNAMLKMDPNRQLTLPTITSHSPKCRIPKKNDMVGEVSPSPRYRFVNSIVQGSVASSGATYSMNNLRMGLGRTMMTTRVAKKVGKSETYVEHAHYTNMKNNPLMTYRQTINVSSKAQEETISKMGHDGYAVKPSLETFVTPNGKVKMICEVEGCTKVGQSRKRCKRHGGGPRCRYDGGCTKSSQGKGLCRKHGGGKQCAIEGCYSGAQLRGLCSKHGGAKLCNFLDSQGVECHRHSRGAGLCAHHGGGKKCSYDQCMRRSRVQGMCSVHHRAQTGILLDQLHSQPSSSTSTSPQPHQPTTDNSMIMTSV